MVVVSEEQIKKHESIQEVVLRKGPFKEIFDINIESEKEQSRKGLAYAEVKGW